jgi:hypothetical protein
MKIDFEYTGVIGTGKYPNLLQFPKTEGQLLFLENNILYGRPFGRLHGDFSSPVWQNGENVSPENNIVQIEIKNLQGFGAVGSYRINGEHKMLIYEYALEMDRYLLSGNIKQSMDTPIASFNLNLENPLNKNPEYEGNVAISEESSLLAPGSKVVFEFSMGDSEPYPMGIFYVDRSNFTLLDESVSVDGRNLIGKALYDQSFDEDNAYASDFLSNILKEILEGANINPDDMLIQTTPLLSGYQFDMRMTYLEGIQEILKALDNWKIEELVDGTVVIGSPNYPGFAKNSSYIFYRNRDIFSRNIVRDDQGSFRRVCVHNGDFSIKLYKDVETYSGWNLQSNKTLYVNVPDGTSPQDAEKFALQIANNLQYVGKVESFTGPFRPQIILGDEAIIIGGKGFSNLGLITEITHRFGKEGFYTDFTVDSGGRLGKGRLSDFIGKITKDKTSSSRIYE